MPEFVKIGAAFTIGLGAGILASKSFFQTKYEKIANEEIESVKASISNRSSHIIEETSLENADQYKKGLDDIYKYPLCEHARDVLGRLIKTAVSDSEFADAVLALKEDNRLCITEESNQEYKPIQIICSLGMRKVE